MVSASDAPAFWGSAENPVYPLSTRLKMALAALEFYGNAVDRIDNLCEQWDATTKGESPTTAEIRAARNRVSDGPKDD